MANVKSSRKGPYLRTAAQIKRIKLMWVAILLTTILGFAVWSLQARPAIATATMASTQSQVTTTSQPTQAEVVKETLTNLTPTAQATEMAAEPIDWVPLSTFGLAAPFSYEFDGICTTVPAGWTPFTPNGEKVICKTPLQNLGKSLVLPAGVAVVPGYKLPETRLTQIAATGDHLEKPWEVEGVNNYWLRFKDTHEKLVRVCLLDEDDEFTDTRSMELIVDEDLSYEPTGGGKCITSLVKDSNLVVFSFLNEIYKTIEHGDYKYYEIHLDSTIQGGVNQELWLGGKPLSNN